MSQIVFYFLHSTSVLSFYIDVVLTLSIILWDIKIYEKHIKNNDKLFFIMSNLQTYSHLKLDFKKVDQHTGGKW